MKLIVTLFLAFLTVFGLWQVNKLDTGYVKLYVSDYLIELNLLGFVILLLLTVFVLYFVLRLFRKLWKAPSSVSEWNQRRQKQQAHEKLGQGYLSLIKGDWKKAEQQLLVKSAHSKVPYVNFLAAAQAAQEQGKIVQRDEYLRQAYEVAPKENLAIGMTKARLHQQAGQMEEALATLEGLSKQGKNNAQYTAMLLQSYEATNNMDGLQRILPAARKQKALPVEALDKIEFEQALEQFVSSEDKPVAWKALPSKYKQQAEFIMQYAGHQIQNGNEQQAEKLVKSALNKNWDDRLVNLYGRILTSNANKQFNQARSWVSARPESAECNLAAGRLAVLASKPKEARVYLEKAIELANLPEAYHELGNIYNSVNDKSRALELYRQGLQSTEVVKSGLLTKPSQG